MQERRCRTGSAQRQNYVVLVKKKRNEEWKMSTRNYDQEIAGFRKLGYPREMRTHRKIVRVVVIGGVRGVQRARSHRAGGCWILLGRLNGRTRRGGLALRGRFLNILSIPKVSRVSKGSLRGEESDGVLHSKKVRASR